MPASERMYARIVIDHTVSYFTDRERAHPMQLCRAPRLRPAAGFRHISLYSRSGYFGSYDSRWVKQTLPLGEGEERRGCDVE
ncbi:hypothetical protein AAHC03_05606 [Spirometra sp. Aus1]